MLIALKFFGIAGVLAIIVLAAVLAGVIVGLLDWHTHRRAPQAVLRGLKAFAAAIGLQLGVATFVTLLVKILFLL
ncbi:hypothetical protein GTY65_36310 [Streptomyces sp. SID8379]|uniref:hypothetical protein n=1 Tax=unclassified Streptomyces TaxID=2593676 RepID=UPI00037EAE4C|nr:MULTISPECIES: hypothetical protein [unclassified Streptomyces]MYW69492.1 hypothetical protein [Streptomyces sp. SID8379]